MISGDNKDKACDKKDKKHKFTNAFTDIDLFLGLLFVCEGYILFASIMQIYFNGKNRIAEIAGTTTTLLIITIYHIIKRKR